MTAAWQRRTWNWRCVRAAKRSPPVDASRRRRRPPPSGCCPAGRSRMESVDGAYARRTRSMPPADIDAACASPTCAYRRRKIKVCSLRGRARLERGRLGATARCCSSADRHWEELFARSCTRESTLSARECELCSATPHYRGELFGHERAPLPGRCAARFGGPSRTLFLDEIGDSSADLQAKLLRVLRRVSSMPAPRARVWSTSHRRSNAPRPEEAVADGGFRDDLLSVERASRVHLAAERRRHSRSRLGT